MLFRSPLVVLLYSLVTPFVAFAINHISCMLLAFIGMYLCISTTTRNYVIALICGILFAYLPLFSVYGLCQYGQPLLLYCFYLLYHNKKKVMALSFIVFYGLMSSLVLVGYAILGFAFLYIFYLIIKKKWKEHLWFSVGIFTLLIVYVITNMQLKIGRAHV